MTFCSGCGHQIHETATACPQCGAVQPTAKREITPAAQGTLWFPVLALVCGLIPMLSIGAAKQWTHDEVLGACMFAIAAMVLGGIGLARQKRGRGMSIAGMVLGVLGLLAAIGTQV